MPPDLFIDRLFGIGWLVFGLSHLLYPGLWTELFRPLRERDTGRLLVGTFTLPLGVAVVLLHNLWAWRIPVLVTVAGWGMVVKSLVYLLVPEGSRRLLPDRARMHRAFRFAGLALMLLGALVTYDSFHRAAP